MSFAANKDKTFVLLRLFVPGLFQLYLASYGFFCVFVIFYRRRINRMFYYYRTLFQNWERIITNWGNFDVLQNRVTVATNLGSIFVLKRGANDIIN